MSSLVPMEEYERVEAQRDALREEFNRINVRDPELMAKARGYANADHGLVVDMQDGTGRTGLYVETGFLRLLFARNEELEHFAQQVYDEAQEQHLVAQAGLLLHPLQP